MSNPAHRHGALNCETCGGALDYSADGLSAVCPYCGNSYVFSAEKSEALALALNRANAMRIDCDFDGAIREYTLITGRNPQDAEAVARAIYDELASRNIRTFFSEVTLKDRLGEDSAEKSLPARKSWQLCAAKRRRSRACSQSKNTRWLRDIYG